MGAADTCGFADGVDFDTRTDSDGLAPPPSPRSPSFTSHRQPAAKDQEILKVCFHMR